MATKIQIINAALVGLALKPLSSLEENTVAQITANSFFNICRDEALRAHPWNFAVTRARLSPDVDAPAFGYSYAFTLPADNLRVMEVSDINYRLEKGKILCDAASIDIIYIYRVVDETQFDASFTACLEALLSSRMAYPLTKSSSQQEVQLAIYQRKLATARNIDAQEQPADDFEESSLITGRY